MIKHIVVYNFADGLSQEHNIENAKKFKRDIERLKNVLEGIITLEVHCDLMPASTSDVAIVSEFENEKALQDYLIHPDHVKVAEFVKTAFKDRKCVDYQV